MPAEDARPEWAKTGGPWCHHCGAQIDTQDCFEVTDIAPEHDKPWVFDRMECVARWACVEAGLFLNPMSQTGRVEPST